MAPMSGTVYKVELAKSGRSSCKACKSHIAKDTPRFGSSGNALHGTYFFKCIGCVTKKQLENVVATLKSVDQLPGLEALDAGVRASILKTFEETMTSESRDDSPKRTKTAQAAKPAAPDAPVSTEGVVVE